MTPAELLIKQRNELKKVIAKFPRQNAQLTLQFIQARFREQGWRNVYFKAWKPRNSKARRNSGRAILTDTGRLRRSIRILKVDGNTSVVGTDVPYADFHNQGFKGKINVPAHKRGKFKKEKVGTGKLTKTGKERKRTITARTGESTVRAHSRSVNMPRRQFMGESRHLEQIIKRKQDADIIRVFQK